MARHQPPSLHTCAEQDSKYSDSSAVIVVSNSLLQGTSVTVTSVTDFVAFCVGASTVGSCSHFAFLSLCLPLAMHKQKFDVSWQK